MGWQTVHKVNSSKPAQWNGFTILRFSGMYFNAVSTNCPGHTDPPPFGCGHTGGNFIWLIVQSKNYFQIRMVTLQVSMYYFQSQKWMHCVNFCSSKIVCCNFGGNLKVTTGFMKSRARDWQDSLLNFFQKWRIGTSFFSYFHVNPETFN
jgi:hypothetical protein